MAVDAHDGTIELQHFDGTLEEVDPEGWLAMHAERIAAPEDWSGSVDITQEDYLPGEHSSLHLDWQHEVDEIDDDLSGNDLADFDELH